MIYTSDIDLQAIVQPLVVANARAGADYEAEVLQQLEEEYPSGTYRIVYNHSLRNAANETVKIEGRYIRPDSQIYNRATGRLVKIVDARTGTAAYLSGPTQQKYFRYLRFRDRLADPLPDIAAYGPDELPPVEFYTRVRAPEAPAEGLGRVASRALGALSLFSVVLGFWRDEQDRQHLEWLRRNDPGYYCSVVQCAN